MTKYEAFRLTEGNIWFPIQIVINDIRVTVKTPSLLSAILSRFFLTSNTKITSNI